MKINNATHKQMYSLKEHRLAIDILEKKTE